MAIADELTKLEANRANIVAAINSKGGGLAENAGLAACPEAISQLSSTGGTTLWTGHVDEAGLRYIGWDDADIANLKANICWNAEQDADYAVPQDHKDLWDACEKVEVNGRTMLPYSQLIKWVNYDLVLKYLPMIDLSGQNAVGFRVCKWLVAIPLIDTSSMTSMVNMFSGCTSLITIPLIDTSSVTRMDAMFRACTSLITIPLLDTSAVTNMSSMFNGCTSLITVPLIDTSSVTNMSEMFNGCTSLITVPLIDTSSVTSMQQMFASCKSLKIIPSLDTNSVSSFYQMFSNCFNLEIIGVFNMSPSCDCRQMFVGCELLRTIPMSFVYVDDKMDRLYQSSAINEILNDDMSRATILSGIITNCRYLKKININFTELCSNAASFFDGSRYIQELSFGDETSFAGITSSNVMMARNSTTSIPKACVTYTMCIQLFNAMLRGVPAYSAASYPMYFESGSTVTDDAAGTLQSLVEQCQAMGWAIYNLTINPYTE